MSHKYWVGLSHVPGIGSIKVKKLLEQFGSAERVWKLSKAELAAIPYIGEKIAGEFQRTREELDLERFLQHCKEAEVYLLCPEDSEFPANLLNIYDPPPVIYYRGALKREDLYSIAIVGSRKMTTYGKRATRMLAAELVAKGFTIVSGMALGVDGVAHEAAMEAGGRTIAVLGSGVDVVYPREHKHVYAEIIKHGAVVSTFPPGTAPERGNFPARNRIISGLSIGTVVVEAGEKSGALITADLALEQNREVFAIPGSIFSPLSAGTNALIQKGAKLVYRTEDILEELQGLHWPAASEIAQRTGMRTGEAERGKAAENGSRAGEWWPKDAESQTFKGGQAGSRMGVPSKHVVASQTPELNERQTMIVDLLKTGEMAMDDLLMQLKIGISELNTVLFELEIMGVITQSPGLKFALS